MTVQSFTNLVTDPKGKGSPTLWQEISFIPNAGSSMTLDSSNVVLTGGPSDNAPSYLHVPDLFWTFGSIANPSNNMVSQNDSNGNWLTYPAVQASSYAIGFSGRTNYDTGFSIAILVSYYSGSGDIGAGDFIDQEFSTFPVIATNEWQDFSAHFITPSGTTRIGVDFGYQTTQSSGLPEDMFLDASAFFIVKDNSLSDLYRGGYFDGDTPTEGGTFFSWTGTPNLSTSQSTANVSLPATSVTNLPLTFEVYRNSDLDGRPVEILNGRMNPVYLEELKGPGGGSFDIMVDDPKIVADPTLLDYRNVIKVKRGNQVIGAFVIQNTSETYVDSANEDGGRVISVSGEGLRTWFHDAVVYPLNGVSALSSDSRVFSWASEKSSWFKPADWLLPSNILLPTASDPNNLWSTYYPGVYPAAQDFPDTSAWWIWGRPENSFSNIPPKGPCYFRYEWDTSTTTQYTVHAAADDVMDLYVDGQNIVSAWSSYNSFSSTDFNLDPGHHILAARVDNSGGNIGGLILALQSRGTPESPVAAFTVAKTGDAGWLVNEYPLREPGWTAGEVLLKLLDEAQARGVLFANLVSPTFTDEYDSNGDLWDRSQAWEFNVGDDYQTVIDKLEELACDVWIDPDSYALYAVRSRGTDRTEDRTPSETDYTNQTQVVNMLDNPSMVGGFDVLAANANLDTNDTSWSKSGSNSLNIWDPAASDSFAQIGTPTNGIQEGVFAFGMQPGHTYTISGWGNVKQVLTGTSLVGPMDRSRTIVVHTTRGAGGTGGNYLGQYDVFASPQVANSVDTPTFVSLTFTLPGETKGVAVRLYLGNTVGQIRWDSLMLVEGNGLEADGSTPIAYFDGDTADSDDYTYSWAGLSNQSTSVRNPARSRAPISPSAVAFRTGRNIVTASEDVTGAVKNALLVNTDGGWVYKESSDPSSALYGKVEGSITTDGGLDLATQVATYAFEQFSTPSTASSYDVIVSDDTVPWKDFFVGDLTLAAKRGYTDTVTRRIYSLSCGEDASGNITYAIEFDTLPTERIDRLEKMIDNITSGTSTSLLGALSNVTVGIGSGGSKSYYLSSGSSGGGGTGGGSVTPPSAPVGLSGYANGYWHQNLAYSRAHLKWSGVTTDVNGSTVLVDHYDVWAKKNRTTAERTSTNLVLNPSFESGTTGVVTSNSAVALSTSWAQSGTQSLRVSPSVASLESYVSLEGGDGGLRSGFAPGNTYTVSAYIHLAAVQGGSTSALARTLSVVYKDSGGAYHWLSTAPAPNAVGTYRLALTVAIPAGATAAYIVLYNGTGTGAATDVYWDAVQVTLTSTLQDYFDGGTTDDDEYTYAWTGSANASTSTRIATDSYEYIGSTENTAVNIERMDPGAYTFVVHAIISGAFSASSSALGLTLPSPTSLLAPPTDPSLVSVNGTVTVSWDGLLGNAAPGKNFSHVYASYGTTATGTFSPIGGTLSGAGQIVIANLTPGSVWYFKLLAVDKSGYTSASSLAVAISVAAYSGSGGAGAYALAVPVGAIVPYAGSSLPSGYAFCDGSAVSRATYADLFTAIGTTYGTGDGSTTFNLPNSKGRVMAGADSTQTEFSNIGLVGGEKTHKLTITEMPAHAHEFSYGGTLYPSFPVSSGSGGNLNFAIGNSGFSPVSISSTGGDGAHNNLQPYLTVNFIIKTTVDSAIPVGTSIEGYWSSAPAGYLLENGAAVSRTTYATLFAMIGTAYGAGDGSTTFNLPDSTGRVLVSKTGSGTFTTLGAKGGEENHQLTVTEMPAHTHGTSPPLSANGDNPGSSYIPTAAGTTYGTYFAPPVSAGGGGAHNNLQPYIVVNRAIKY